MLIMETVRKPVVLEYFFPHFFGAKNGTTYGYTSILIVSSHLKMSSHRVGYSWDIPYLTGNWTGSFPSGYRSNMSLDLIPIGKVSCSNGNSPWWGKFPYKVVPPQWCERWWTFHPNFTRPIFHPHSSTQTWVIVLTCSPTERVNSNWGST